MKVLLLSLVVSLTLPAAHSAGTLDLFEAIVREPPPAYQADEFDLFGYSSVFYQSGDPYNAQGLANKVGNAKLVFSVCIVNVCNLKII